LPPSTFNPLARGPARVDIMSEIALKSVISCRIESELRD
jgi:hypothetical protein